MDTTVYVALKVGSLYTPTEYDTRVFDTEANAVAWCERNALGLKRLAPWKWTGPGSFILIFKRKVTKGVR